MKCEWEYETVDILFVIIRLSDVRCWVVLWISFQVVEGKLRRRSYHVIPRTRGAGHNLNVLGCLNNPSLCCPGG